MTSVTTLTAMSGLWPCSRHHDSFGGCLCSRRRRQLHGLEAAGTGLSVIVDGLANPSAALLLPVADTIILPPRGGWRGSILLRHRQCGSTVYQRGEGLVLREGIANLLVLPPGCPL